MIFVREPWNPFFNICAFLVLLFDMSHAILIYYSCFCFYYISAFPHQVLNLMKQTNKQKICHIPFSVNSGPWLFHKGGRDVRDLVSSLCAKLVNILKALFEKTFCAILITALHLFTCMRLKKGTFFSVCANIWLVDE